MNINKNNPTYLFRSPLDLFYGGSRRMVGMAFQGVDNDTPDGKTTTSDTKVRG